jgi:hypothetical protein
LILPEWIARRFAIRSDSSSTADKDGRPHQARSQLDGVAAKLARVNPELTKAGRPRQVYSSEAMFGRGR